MASATYCNSILNKLDRYKSRVNMSWLIVFSDVSGEWICLQFRRSILRSKFGIAVKDEAAMPVGKKDCL